MTATISADVPLKVAQWRLREFAQWVPIDGEADALVGTLVERNSTGPLRLGYGAWRDLLLGVQFLDRRGRLITAGGRTVKNVAGYDLTKFMVGQRGTFGKLVTITTRTWRRPAGAILAQFDPQVRLVNELLPTPLRPQWTVLSRDALLLGYLGDDHTLTYYEAALPERGPRQLTRRGFEEDVAHRTELWRARGKLSLRAAVPPMRVREFAEGAGLEDWVADAAFGIVLAEVPDGRGDAIQQAAERVGGSVMFIRSSDGALVDVSLRPGEEQLIAQLKEAFGYFEGN